MSDCDPIEFRRRPLAATQIASGDAISRGSVGLNGSLARGTGNSGTSVVAYDRHELHVILGLYGRMVAAGEWRDYALDFTPTHAVFSIFRRSAEVPLYRIVKDPKLARRQGGYSVVVAGGQILKRGHDLARVISVLDKRLKVVT
ncbi:MAG TPA: DUF2794 domain-containing protein [Beijerinckiaceae bacterium]|nr:DUF2794 domain-containing protein [Beijerinckiaceae bacterium]